MLWVHMQNYATIPGDLRVECRHERGGDLLQVSYYLSKAG